MAAIEHEPVRAPPNCDLTRRLSDRPRTVDRCIAPQPSSDVALLRACKHPASLASKPLLVFEPAQFLGGADRRLAVRADAKPAIGLQKPVRVEKSVAEIRFGADRDANRRPPVRDSLEFSGGRVRRMHETPLRRQQFGFQQEFDGTPPGLALASLNFAQLFGDMNVHWQRRVDVAQLRCRLAQALEADRPQAVKRGTGAHRVAGRGAAGRRAAGRRAAVRRAIARTPFGVDACADRPQEFIGLKRKSRLLAS